MHDHHRQHHDHDHPASDSKSKDYKHTLKLDNFPFLMPSFSPGFSPRVPAGGGGGGGRSPSKAGDGVPPLHRKNQGEDPEMLDLLRNQLEQLAMAKEAEVRFVLLTCLHGVELVLVLVVVSLEAWRGVVLLVLLRRQGFGVLTRALSYVRKAPLTRPALMWRSVHVCHRRTIRD